VEDPLLRFAGLPWNDIAPGAREKAFQFPVFTVRLLELSPGFEETQWCRRQHLGFVLQGSLEIEFVNRSVAYQQGDGLVIPGGESGRHRSKVGDKTVVLYLIDPR
jgi:hypothetical protein